MTCPRCESKLEGVAVSISSALNRYFCRKCRYYYHLANSVPAVDYYPKLVISGWLGGEE